MLLVENLKLLNEKTWFEQCQCWACHHVDGQKYIGFVNESSAIEPLVGVFRIDIDKNQCGVEETQNGKLEAK